MNDKTFFGGNPPSAIHLSSHYEGVGLRAPSERKPSCQEEIEPWKRVPGKMTSRMWAADKRLHEGVKLVNWSTFFVNWSTSSTVEDVSFHLCARCRVWEQAVKHPQSTCINKHKHKNKNRVFVRCWSTKTSVFTIVHTTEVGHSAHIDSHTFNLLFQPLGI